MDYSLPHRIKNERDLQIYENFIKNDDAHIKPASAIVATEKNASKCVLPQTNATADNAFFNGYLKNHRGKLIKVESLIGSRLESRIGILLEVGNDYIVLKLPRNNCSMLMQMAAIKYVTIVHDNDIVKTY